MEDLGVGVVQQREDYSAELHILKPVITLTLDMPAVVGELQAWQRDGAGFARQSYDRDPGKFYVKKRTGIWKLKI